jgi:hypothetical protein
MTNARAQSKIVDICLDETGCPRWTLAHRVFADELAHLQSEYPGISRGEWTKSVRKTLTKTPTNYSPEVVSLVKLYSRYFETIPCEISEYPDCCNWGLSLFIGLVGLVLLWFGFLTESGAALAAGCLLSLGLILLCLLPCTNIAAREQEQEFRRLEAEYEAGLNRPPEQLTADGEIQKLGPMTIPSKGCDQLTHIR